VDNLHEMAGSTSVLHLHGTINDLRCMDCNTISSREAWQQRLRDLNPAFVKHHDEPSHLVHARPTPVHHPRDGHTHLISPALGASPVSLPSTSASSLVASMRPDGDVDLPQSLDFSNFVLPSCPVCTDGHGNPLQPRAGDVDPNAGVGADGAVGVGIEPMQRGILKPDLVFFGANVPKHVHARADELLAAADGILVCGTSLTVWSAFRLIRTTLDRVMPGQQLSVVQLAEQLARSSRQAAQGQPASDGVEHGANRIQQGAAILSPVTPFQVQLDCSGSAASSPRVPSVIPIVVP
jgi:NAD-dependent SIR2 family protein deacetylase